MQRCSLRTGLVSLKKPAMDTSSLIHLPRSSVDPEIGLSERKEQKLTEEEEHSKRRWMTSTSCRLHAENLHATPHPWGSRWRRGKSTRRYEEKKDQIARRRHPRGSSTQWVKPGAGVEVLLNDRREPLQILNKSYPLSNEGSAQTDHIKGSTSSRRPLKGTTPKVPNTKFVCLPSYQ